MQRSAGADAAADIGEQLPQRRRRLGSALLALGVLLLALQSLVEWWLPYDPTALEALRRAWRLPGLNAAQLVWGWALLCALALLALDFARGARQALPLGALAGALLGSAHGAAGGAAASLAMLMLAGVASLGWQGAREGGLALLLATALAVAGWDIALSAFPSLWTAAAVLVAMFVWIDRQHLRAGDRRLFAALAERDALITRLDQRGAELTALQKARTRLLASISHDLRQPLQAVRLFAEALQRRPEGADAAVDEARRQDLLRQQMRAADDAVAMLDQFSEFSAIEQGALQSHPTLLDLRDLLDGVAATLQATHPGSALVLRVHGRRQWVHSDRTQLARLVQNLAGNAVRYSLGARPGRPARVVLAVRPHRMAGGEGLAIDVVDNGRGIPADQLDAIFEPYVQLADASGGASRGGRGLGLAIVRGLVAQLGLALAPVRSTPGRGTRSRAGAAGAAPRRAGRGGRAGTGCRRPPGRLAACAAGRRAGAARRAARRAGRRRRHRRRRRHAGAAGRAAGRRTAIPRRAGLRPRPRPRPPGRPGRGADAARAVGTAGAAGGHRDRPHRRTGYAADAAALHAAGQAGAAGAAGGHAAAPGASGAGRDPVTRRRPAPAVAGVTPPRRPHGRGIRGDHWADCPTCVQ
ncbi:MAG: HAMP domain-containing histidine kinase [Rubrivivax sp.]|nr:HAMP domain-containing histidine kinase [Rubrivivax sp.]